MSKELIFVLVFFWIVSATYIMYTHNKNSTLSLGIIIGAILLGPILALFVKDDTEHTIKKLHYIEENDRHRRWFQLNDMVYRERIQSNWSRTIPPPPPISRVGLPNRKPKNKLTDFKFLKG
jgi:hypothetical protein